MDKHRLHDDRSRQQTGGWRASLLTCAALLLGAAGPLEAGLTVSEVSAIEAQVKMPKGAGPPDDYVRYYATFTAASKKGDRNYMEDVPPGHRMVIGRWLSRSRLAGSQRVFIVADKDLPMVMDGGCGIVNVTFDLTSHRLIGAWCNGVA